jgi:HSP20 family molecular chaperone IbpA
MFQHDLSVTYLRIGTLIRFPLVRRTKRDGSEPRANASKSATKTSASKSATKTKTVSILKTQPTQSQLDNGMDEVPSTAQLNQIFNFPPPFEPYDTDATAYQTKVDLGGFSNENISLDLDGRRLIVSSYLI